MSNIDIIQSTISRMEKQDNFIKENPCEVFFCPTCNFVYSNSAPDLINFLCQNYIEEWEENAGQPVPTKECNYCLTQTKQKNGTKN